MIATASRRADDWLTAAPSPNLSGEIAIPGDKSMSHRAVIFGALAQGETRIDGLLESDDVLATVRAVRAFGVKTERVSPGRWRIVGAEWRSPGAPIDCGNSGTGARLLIGAAAGLPIAATFTGDASLRNRPMRRIFEPLRRMGARIAASEGERLPCTLEGGGLNGIVYRNSHASAQVKSAILLAGLRAEGEVAVVEALPSRDHSERMLGLFGCEVATSAKDGGRCIALASRRVLSGSRVAIPGDPSSAAFAIVAALISPGSAVAVPAVVVNPLRAGLLAALTKMGAQLAVTDRRSMGGEEIANLKACFGPLRGIDLAAECAPAMIDEYPILAVAAACAEGRTILRGLGELRVKESDRVAATVAGLRACGVDAWDQGDDLVVEGRGGPPSGGATIAAGGDHRIAMGFLTLGFAARAPVSVDSAAMIATSFPGFAAAMQSIGGRIE